MDNYLRAEISASAIRHNVGLIRNLLGEGVRLCAVVKADAYGHGLKEVLGVLGPAADILAVATCAEAAALRDLGWAGPVIIFATAAASDAATLAELIAADVTLTVTGLDELILLAEASEKARRPAEVHVNIDTGMTRNGAPPAKAPAIVAAAGQSERVRITGMYTHFACAEDWDKSSTREQLSRFLNAVDACGPRDGLILHSANSAATIDLPEAHLDMVRPGLALYGYQPIEPLRNVLPLRPAMRLVGPIALIKDVPAGSSVGYGLTYTFEKDARVALVPVGYADGYFRTLSNAASMRVGDLDCPVRGRVSMDQTVIEITDVPDAAVGDEVEIISPDPAAPNSVENLSQLAGTIPDDIVVRLGNRITRVMVD